eukprot:comp17963_c0_seq1/m.18314 comp17963_c0_seq1/g.18314  ORF comp17963_c0_seq1/g.18314 comp17963_c0_seq1/m.18314 type:complete len:582 (-) comp17963_c0_seq1:627-2372(-)
MARNKLFTVCLFILVVEMCERLSYYSFAGSQRNYLQQLGFSNASSTAINAAFSVLTYITPIFGGWLADAKAGRYKTIVIFSLFYCVGVALAATAAYPTIMSKGLYLFSVMALITLGSGGIKPNIANFGGDQYATSIPEEARQQEQFFSYFYLMINVGAGIAYGYMVTLATNGAPPAIPEEYGFFATYMVASGAMFLAFLCFLAGTPKYVRTNPSGDSLRGLIYYIWEGAKRTTKGKVALAGWFSTIAFLVMAVASAFVTDKATAKSLAWVLLALAMMSSICLVVAHISNSYLDGIPDHPDDLLSLSEAQATLDVVPTLLVANVTFSIGYNAMNGPFQSSACQMDLRVGSSQINGAFFNIADCFAIVVFVPLLENLLVPMIEKFRGGKKVTGTQRLIAGMITTVLAMVSATALEIVRRNAEVLSNEADSNCAPEGVKMSNISGFTMFIPFALIGFAEVFINPFLYFFTYEQTPPRARSISQAFNLLAMGALSNGFTTALTLAMIDFYTDDLNEGHIEYFYYVSAAAAIVGIPLTLYVQNRFKPKNFGESGEASKNDFIPTDVQGEGVVVDKSIMEAVAEKKN